MGNHPQSITPYILFIKDMKNITQNMKTQKQCVLCVGGGWFLVFFCFVFWGDFFVLFCFVLEKDSFTALPGKEGHSGLLLSKTMCPLCVFCFEKKSENSGRLKRRQDRHTRWNGLNLFCHTRNTLHHRSSSIYTMKLRPDKPIVSGECI